MSDTVGQNRVLEVGISFVRAVASSARGGGGNPGDIVSPFKHCVNSSTLGQNAAFCLFGFCLRRRLCGA